MIYEIDRMCLKFVQPITLYAELFVFNYDIKANNYSLL